MKQPVERRLAAILAADVAGYSRLMGADEEGTLDRLKAHRRELVDPKIREHRGRIVKTTGDGMLVEFPSVVEAVRCGVEVQRAMLDRNAETLEDSRITFRIGVNLGDIIVDGDDIYGDGVNVAARLEGLGEPGGICISRVVRDQIRDKLPYQFDDLGEQSVKNIARPVRVYAMTADAVASTPLVTAPAPLGRARTLQRLIIPGSAVALLCIALAVWWSWPKGTPPTAAVSQPSPQITTAVPNTPAPRLSFVVLPFENLSKDPDQEYFADGITDDLTTDLSRISGSFVIARNTAFTYKGKAVDAKQIGRELGVRYVIEGSVRRTGDQVHVNVQLIDAASSAHVWADRFDSDRASLAEMQSEITARLANTLHVALVRDAGRRIEEEKTIDPDAQDLVLRGFSRLYETPSAETRRQAEQAFAQALQIDPRSVDARIGLAWAIMQKRFLLAVGPGQPPAAITQGEKALRLDPRGPGLWGTYFVLGMSHYFLGQLDDGVELLTKARNANPNNAHIYFNLAAALALKGDIAAGKAALYQGLKLKPELNSLTAWAEHNTWENVPTFVPLREKTLFAGLRRLGFPEK
jgi:TolB-like protein/class 3 adenylate cyclase